MSEWVFGKAVGAEFARVWATNGTRVCGIDFDRKVLTMREAFKMLKASL